jgi:thiol-disulfide isomerase/thioredoxin
VTTLLCILSALGGGALLVGLADTLADWAERGLHWRRSKVVEVVCDEQVRLLREYAEPFCKDCPELLPVLQELREQLESCQGVRVYDLASAYEKGRDECKPSAAS